MSHPGNILIRHIKSIKGISESPYAFKKGKAMSVCEEMDNAYLLVADGRIADFGPDDEAPDFNGPTLDASGRHVLPAWCDSHTHIVYASSREKEFVARIMGKSYEQIAREGGGILNSARKLAQTDEHTLYEAAEKRLNEVIGFGTGAIEIKSGYGLSLESELKMLRVIQALKNNSEATIKATFLGAHAIPEQYKSNRQGYIDLIINQMLPAVANENLADYCDVFCDEGFFTVEETDRILNAASAYGLKPKIHANELANSGGVQVGIQNNAISVDHLERIENKEIMALLDSDTIPTLLPTTSFFLNIPFAPARQMIEAGLGFALATDYNPGSTPSGNFPLLMSIAALKMKLLPNEIFNAVTINGAAAMEVDKELGSITIGKIANLIVTKAIPSFDYLLYAFGSQHIDKVILNGKLVG